MENSEGLKPFNKKQWLANSPKDNIKVKAVLFCIITIYVVCAVLLVVFIMNMKNWLNGKVVKYLFALVILGASTRALWGFRTDCALLCCADWIKRENIDYGKYVKKYGLQLFDKSAQKDHEFFIEAGYVKEDGAAKRNFIIRVILAFFGEVIPDIFFVLALLITVINLMTNGGNVWANVAWVWAGICIALYLAFYIVKQVLQSYYNKKFKNWWDGWYGELIKEKETEEQAAAETE